MNTSGQPRERVKVVVETACLLALVAMGVFLALEWFTGAPR